MGVELIESKDVKSNNLYYLKNHKKLIQYSKERYKKNNGTVKKQRQLYYQENKQEILIKVKEYQRKNPEKLRQRKQNYYQENKESVLLRVKQYQSQNKGKVVHTYKKTYQKNKEQKKARSVLIYEKTKEHVCKLKGQRSVQRKLKLFKILGMKCVCCNISEYWNLTIDHKIPLRTSKRQSAPSLYRELLENPEKRNTIQLLCFGCNVSKNRFEKCKLDHAIS